MRRDSGTMMNMVAVGIGAGLVSALLFAVVVTGSPLGIILSYIAPLPVLIAALGWNHRAGLIAATVGALATVVILRPTAGFAYVVGSALPAWWLAYLALLGRGRPDGTMEWYPLGRLLVWIGATAVLITVLGIVALGRGDADAYRATLRAAIEGVVRLQLGTARGDAGQNATLLNPAVLDTLVAAIPFLAAATLTLVLAMNVWIAAKVVSISQRLPRPWPDIPALLVPRNALWAVALAIGLSLLPDFAGAAGIAVAGAATLVFALQGLALLHDTTRGRPARPFILGVAYLLTLLVGHTFLPILALAGMTDAALNLRARLRGGSGPRPT
jgi:hypothetical protein